MRGLMWILTRGSTSRHELTFNSSLLYPSSILYFILLHQRSQDVRSCLPLVSHFRSWITIVSHSHIVVVCAICSRFYTEKSEIYPIAMHFAKHSAASALTDGWKSVELCQAYILMSIFAVPARRWEEDRSWLYTGLAIRYDPHNSPLCNCSI